MPTIVKYAHVENLITELRKPEYEGLSEPERFAKLEHPRPTGGKVYAEIPVIEIGKVLFKRDKLHVLQDAAATNLNAKRVVSLLNLASGGDASLTVSPEDTRVKEVFTALVQDGLLDMDDIAAIRELAEEDETGQSFAQEIGIGHVYRENMKQLSAYLDMTETEMREDLAGILLLRCLRHLQQQGMTVEQYVQTDAWTVRLATIADYTGITDAVRLQELLEILVAEAQAQQVGES